MLFHFPRWHVIVFFSYILHWLLAAGGASMSNLLAEAVSYRAQVLAITCHHLGTVAVYLSWISSFPHKPSRNQSHVSEMAVLCTGDNRFKNHVGLIAESRALLGRTGLAVQLGNCHRVIACLPGYHYALGAVQGSHWYSDNRLLRRIVREQVIIAQERFSTQDGDRGKFQVSPRILSVSY